MEEKVPINLKALAIKCRSKKELYNVLLNDCGVYMPPIQDANAEYVRGVVTGLTKFVRTKDIKVIQVPFIKGLNTEDILNFAMKHVKIMEYLPQYICFRLPNRQWFSNLVNTLCGPEFKKLINSKMEEREKMIINKKSFTFKVLPEFLEAFKSSNSVSVVGGRSHFLLKPPSGRKRKYEETKEIVASTHDQDIRAAELEYEIELLNEKITEYKSIQLEDAKYRQIVDSLIEKGIISQEGEEILKF